MLVCIGKQWLNSECVQGSVWISVCKLLWFRRYVYWDVASWVVQMNLCHDILWGMIWYFISLYIQLVVLTVELFPLWPVEWLWRHTTVLQWTQIYSSSVSNHILFHHITVQHVGVMGGGVQILLEWSVGWWYQIVHWYQALVQQYPQVCMMRCDANNTN